MFAIVTIAGQQFKVEKGQEIFVHQLAAEQDTAVSFDQVLLVENEGSVKIGDPVLEGVTVEAKVLEHVKGDKVIVFKKKRRKGYVRKKGHRQRFTKLEITSIAG